MSNVDLGQYSKRLVQYFWDPAPLNDDASGSPIWCLGQRYAVKPTPSKTPTLPPGSSGTPSDASTGAPTHSRASRSSDASSATEDSLDDTADDNRMYEEAREIDGDGGWPLAFLDDFESRIWMTYRSNFPSIPRAQDQKATSAMSFSVRLRSQLASQGGFTSDTGWGCMIRSGQCLLSNALLMLRLGREWRRRSGDASERDLLALFADDPKAPFSIHRFVEHGALACGKHPGEWFGPSATARCIQALASDHDPAHLKVYMTGDGADVYQDAVFKIAKSSDGVFTPVLLLIGIRLGIDRVTPVYWEALKASLQMKQSIGIAGGRPSSSHYFIGTQGPYFFYLDPHTTRPALPLHPNPADYTPDEIDSCHTRRLRRIHIKEMDPSMLIAFLIKDEEDWRDWREGIASVQGKQIIHVADREPVLGAQGAEMGVGVEREGAIDEVQAFDDEEDDTL